MNQKLLLVLSLVALLVVGLFVFGVIDFLVKFFAQNVLFFVVVIGMAIILLAFKSKNQRLALSGLSIVLVAFAMDFYLPPMSALCFNPSDVGLAFVQTNPETSLAIDTAVCKLWVEATNFNPVFFTYSNSSISIAFLFAPFLIMIALLLACLANWRYPKLWIGAFTLFGYAVLLLFIFSSETVASMSLTMASVIAYLVVAPVFFIAGNFLLPFGNGGK